MTNDASASASCLDDAELVAAAKVDRRAFAPLYRRYVGPVYRYCYHRLGSKEDAEDATSQVFAKALGALSTCRDRAFRSWLFAIAHNVVADHYRSRPLVVSIEEAHALPDGAPLPEDVAASASQEVLLRTLLRQLTPDQRRVLELRLVGLTDTEIARVLGRSRGAIRASQFRATLRLRTLLTAENAATEVEHAKA